MGKKLMFPDNHKFANRDDVWTEALGQALFIRNLERGDYDDIIIEEMAKQCLK